MLIKVCRSGSRTSPGIFVVCITDRHRKSHLIHYVQHLQQIVKIHHWSHQSLPHTSLYHTYLYNIYCIFMMLPSLPLLRHPRPQQPHLVDRSNITRRSLRQSQKQGGHNNVATTTTTIHWMAFVIIVIIATTFTTISSVAGFQRHTQYPLLPNGLRTNPSLYKSAPFSRTNAVETTTRTPTISIQPWHTQQIHLSSTRRYKTQLYFMGSDSGILGVGGPEVVRFRGLQTYIYLMCKILLKIEHILHLSCTITRFSSFCVSVFDCTGWVFCSGTVRFV